MTAKSRLHIYTHKGPGDTAYIIGEPAALLNLSRILKNAAANRLGVDIAKHYTSDGHEFNVLVTANASEPEWQTAEPCYSLNKSEDDFESIKIYKEYQINNK